jgi:hypothetical protein
MSTPILTLNEMRKVLITLSTGTDISVYAEFPDEMSMNDIEQKLYKENINWAQLEKDGDLILYISAQPVESDTTNNDTPNRSLNRYFPDLKL